jgi:hypothetical protein
LRGERTVIAALPCHYPEFRWFFAWLGPKPYPYPENPETLGGHLLKRRSETGLTQKAVVSQLEVNTWTYLLWETDGAKPTVWYYPVILRLLGYDPFPPPETLPGALPPSAASLAYRARKRPIWLVWTRAPSTGGKPENGGRAFQDLHSSIFSKFHDLRSRVVE